MEFEWDGAKAASNFHKHGVDFADAVTVLYDETAITIREEAVADEVRFITVGMDAIGRILLVVYAWRSERVRIISARKATSHERQRYEIRK